MAQKIDMIGKRFGRLVVLKEAEKSKNGKSRYLCKCDCGNEIVVEGYCLRSGTTKSCGCLRRETSKKSATTHGFSKEKLFNVWRCMMTRCYNSKHTAYEYYHGRGIYVCEEWRTSYPKFKEFMLRNGWHEDEFGKYTIDRIDNNGPYCPENCRVVSMKEQSFNKSNNHLISDNKGVRTITKVAQEKGISSKNVFNRINKGWTEERALNTPVKEEHQYYANGEWHTINEWAQILGVDLTMVRNRIRDYTSMQEVYDFLSQGKVKSGGNRKSLTVGKESHCVKDWACVLGITYHELRKRLKTESIEDIVKEIRKKQVD